MILVIGLKILSHLSFDCSRKLLKFLAPPKYEKVISTELGKASVIECLLGLGGWFSIAFLLWAAATGKIRQPLFWQRRGKWVKAGFYFEVFAAILWLILFCLIPT